MATDETQFHLKISTHHDVDHATINSPVINVSIKEYVCCVTFFAEFINDLKS